MEDAQNSWDCHISRYVWKDWKGMALIQGMLYAWINDKYTGKSPQKSKQNNNLETKSMTIINFRNKTLYMKGVK